MKNPGMRAGLSRVGAAAIALALAAAPVTALGEQETQGKWERLWGQGALDTMETIVDQWLDQDPGPGFGRTVILTTVNGYWDALSGSGAAGFCNGPVLMTDSTQLSSQTAAVLKKLAPERIVVCGGTLSVSDEVVDEAIAATGVETTAVRYWGEDATDTAVDIFRHAEELGDGETWATTAIVATDTTYHDALAASPVAYARHLPIFLAQDGTDMTYATLSAMAEGGITDVLVVGGEQSVTPEAVAAIQEAGITVERRLSGATAVETSEAIAEYAVTELGMSERGLGVATTTGYHDALAGGAYCGFAGFPLVLVSDGDSTSSDSYIATHADALSNGYVFGGQMSVTPETLDTIDEVAGQPLVAELCTEYDGEEFWGHFDLNNRAMASIREQCATHGEDVRPVGLLASQLGEQAEEGEYRSLMLCYLYEDNKPIKWVVVSVELGTGEYEGEFLVSKPVELAAGGGALFFGDRSESWDDIWEVLGIAFEESELLKKEGWAPEFKLYTWEDEDGGKVEEWLCSKDNALYVLEVRTVDGEASIVDDKTGMLDLMVYAGMA